MVYYIVSVLFLLFFWCPCVAINNVGSVQYNGGLLPDILLLTQCYFHRGTRFKCHEELLYLQPLIPPKRFDIPPPLLGDAQKEDLARCDLFFLEYIYIYIYKYIEVKYKERVWVKDLNGTGTRTTYSSVSTSST